MLYAVAVAARGDALFLHGLGSGIVVMAAAAIEGVAVWKVTRRLSLSRRRSVSFHLAHLSLAIVYAVVWVGVTIGWLWIVAGGTVAREVFQLSASWQIFLGLWIYGVVAGISYVIRTQRRLRRHQVMAARAEAAAARAHLAAIRAQLHPHFLFNALHSLDTLVRDDPVAATDAIERLGDLLRYALDQGTRDTVRLADEWRFASNYLALQHLRLSDRLRIVDDIDEAALTARVPPFLLQPLVENAVRHGIATQPAGGTLTVRARAADATLLIEVIDDGDGADPSQLERAPGLGLRALRRQLAARYADRAHMTVVTAPGSGFAVHLSLPLHAALPPATAALETGAGV